MNALPILLLGGAALLVMGGGKKKNGKNGKNGEANGEKANGYKDTIYISSGPPAFKKQAVLDVNKGDEFLIILPKEPDAIWDVSHEYDDLEIIKKSKLERVVKMVKPRTVAATEHANRIPSQVAFSALHPTNYSPMETTTLTFEWAGFGS